MSAGSTVRVGPLLRDGHQVKIRSREPHLSPDWVAHNARGLTFEERRAEALPAKLAARHR